jgi:anti-anti-sigma regulatory factor
MAVSIERKADFHILVFHAELNIFSVRDDFDSLQSLAQEALSQLMIDLSAVQDFDSAGLQLLLYLQQTLKPEQPLRWIGLDNPVIAKVLGLFRLELNAVAEEA